MVDKEISSNMMKSPSPKCCMTFWEMTIHNDTLNLSDILSIVNLLPNWTVLSFKPYHQISGGFHRTLHRMPTEDAYSSGHLVLSYLGLALVLMLRPFSLDFVMFSDFEFRTFLGVSILLLKL